MQNLHPTKLVLGLLAAPLAALSAWLCAAVAKYGVHLDPSGINALAVSGAAGAVALIAKLIHDVEAGNPRVAAVIHDVEASAPAIAAAVAKADPSLAGELAGWSPATQ